MVFDAETPTEGRVRQLGTPIQFGGTPCEPWRLPPPGFGEHTEEVLRSLGYDDEAIGELASMGVTESVTASAST
jgi:formyl-CoA transferase